MEGFIEKLASLQKFLNNLSWNNLAKLFAFILLISMAYGFYEAKDIISGAIKKNDWSLFHPINPADKKLSKTTTDKIDSIIHNSDLIIAIVISSIDFTTNERYDIYASFGDKKLEDIYRKYKNDQIPKDSLFNDDPIHDRRIAQLITGEYICDPYGITIGAHEMPETEKYIVAVCTNSIPPSYGKTSGLVSIFLNRQPTAEEIDKIRILIKDLSQQISDKDFK